MPHKGHSKDVSFLVSFFSPFPSLFCLRGDCFPLTQWQGLRQVIFFALGGRYFSSSLSTLGCGALALSIFSDYTSWDSLRLCFHIPQFHNLFHQSPSGIVLIMWVSVSASIVWPRWPECKSLISGLFFPLLLTVLLWVTHIQEKSWMSKTSLIDYKDLAPSPRKGCSFFCDLLFTLGRKNKTKREGDTVSSAHMFCSGVMVSAWLCKSLCTGKLNRLGK